MDIQELGWKCIWCYICCIYWSRIGLWFYAKVDNAPDYPVERWGWSWLQHEQDDAWRKRYPKITAKIDELKNLARDRKEEKMNAKFSIGIVIAIVLQVSRFCMVDSTEITNNRHTEKRSS